MMELAGAILIVMGAIFAGAVALTLLWLAIAEWIYWGRLIRDKREARWAADE